MSNYETPTMSTSVVTTAVRFASSTTDDEVGRCPVVAPMSMACSLSENEHDPGVPRHEQRARGLFLHTTCSDRHRIDFEHNANDPTLVEEDRVTTTAQNGREIFTADDATTGSDDFTSLDALDRLHYLERTLCCLHSGCIGDAYNREFENTFPDVRVGCGYLADDEPLFYPFAGTRVFAWLALRASYARRRSAAAYYGCPGAELDNCTSRSAAEWDRPTIRGPCRRRRLRVGQRRSNRRREHAEW
jgi:hypothetical protein